MVGGIIGYVHFDSWAQSDISWDIVECEINNKRQHNAVFPDGDVHCNYIKLSVIPIINDSFLYEWYKDKTHEAGKIQLIIPDIQNEITRLVTFDDAECFLFKEEYDIENEHAPHIITVEFIANIEIDTVQIARP